MSIRDVNSKKFDVLYNKRISTNSCPACHNHGTEIIVNLPLYGNRANAVYVKCKHCGFSSHDHSAVACFHDIVLLAVQKWTAKGERNDYFNIK